MVIEYKNSDMFNTDAQVIIHQVNCRGTMDSAVNKLVKARYPSIYKEYVQYCTEHSLNELIGSCLINPIPNSSKYIASVFGQINYGTDNKRYTSYDALDVSFSKLAQWCKEHNITRIAMPDKMGCDKDGGAQWRIITSLLWEKFYALTMSVLICNYDDKQLNLNLIY